MQQHAANNGERADPESQAERQICCSMTSVLVSVARAEGGDARVAALLARAGSRRELAHLEDPDNWISLAEANALLAAGVAESGDETFPRRVGEHTLRRHAGTQVSTLLRSLGTTEAVLERVTQTAAKLSTVTHLETLEAEPGHALVCARAREGFERTRHQCDWAAGLIASTAILFGLPPARVSERECQVRGDEQCLYEVDWDAELAAQQADPQLRVTALEAQMIAMQARLASCYATAGDLVSAADLATVLQRIVDRAATAVRAPAYVLAVRDDAGELGVYRHGLDELAARELADAALHGRAVAGSALIAEVASSRRSYGRLIARYAHEMEFFPQENELLGMYAQHAAAVLDMATALHESARRHDEISALHALALALAEAGTTEDVAERITAAVPDVVDCDRMSVWLWDSAGERLRVLARAGGLESDLSHLRDLAISASDTPHLARMIAAPEPMFFGAHDSDPYVARLMSALGVCRMVVVPITARGAFLGALTVSVAEQPARLSPTRELLAELTAVAALAATAIRNGRLVDTLQHRASHDSLTGVLNRVGFRLRIDTILERSASHDGRVGLLFVDLDEFKQVNDLYGHDVGDELIRQVAARLRATTRAGDTVARLGGDEFAIILEDVERVEDVRAAESHVREAFAERFRIGDLDLLVRASVGGGISPDDGETIGELIKHADAAMYIDKSRAARAPIRA